MEEILTRKGVLIDVCPSCKGVYLDQGELNFFVRNRKILLQYETRGLEAAHDIAYKCPKCPETHSNMRIGRIPGFPFQVEECGSCRGIFFDAHEFKKIQSAKEFRSLRLDSSVSLKRPIVRLGAPSKAAGSGAGRNIRPAAPVKIPSLGLTTAAVCCGLYGILFAAIVFFVELGALGLLAGAGITLAFAAAQFYFGPILMDWQLRLIGSLDWTPLSRLPPSFKAALERLCGESRLPIPKVGIINDSSPAAYTYGRTPRSARLVFSRGMFELLDEDEAEAVLAHELGHIKNWDFAIMAAIKVVPLLLYIIYRYFKSSLEANPPKDGKKGDPRAAALIASYIFYLISEYLVLFVSRVREYAADKFSCYASKKPNALLTALVKISYGLLSAEASKSPAGGDSSGSSSRASKKKSSREDRLRAMEALNILSLSRSKQMALASQGEGDHFSPEAIQDIMRWDLWSPWAFYYEIHSTHPLTAKRINAIGSYALAMGQEPYLKFDRQKPESYWDDFFLDISVLFLPYILAAGGLISFLWMGGMDFGSLNAADMLPSKEGAEGALKKPALGYGPLGFGLLGLSIGALIRLACSYPFGRFRPHSVSSLLKLIKVSPVRSFPVRLRGRILGRGEAGQLFSEDFVLKDKTGIIYLNHEPFGLNMLFALFRYKKFQGREVSVTGWYRRSPSPYVEVRSIQTMGPGPSDSAGGAAGRPAPAKEAKSWAYTFYYKLAFCLIGLAASLWLILF